jgi:hypothetical protein
MHDTIGRRFGAQIKVEGLASSERLAGGLALSDRARPFRPRNDMT